MVFFTCNACGESLKKAQVDKHLSVCRGCQVLSCIDCGKDFWGDDYKSHVKCVSEDQKYGGKGYEAKANKGDVKQQQWIQRIQEAMNKPGINPKLKDVLSQVSSYENVPRKKAKFQNWMKNSLRIFNSNLQDQVWEIFSATISSQPEAKPAVETSKDLSHPPHPHPHVLQERKDVEEQARGREKNKQERKEGRQKKKKKEQAESSSEEEEKNGEIPSESSSEEEEKNGEIPSESSSDEEEKNGEIPSEKQQKKRKREAEEYEDRQHAEEKRNKRKKHKREEPNGEPSLADQQEEDEQSVKGKFNWKGTIKAVLRQAPDEGLALKRLRKKVLAAYYSFCEDGNYKSEEELFSLFNKKINNPKFKILKDKVRLLK